jgi:heme-degrading monooxygenase HmoA
LAIASTVIGSSVYLPTSDERGENARYSVVMVDIDAHAPRGRLPALELTSRFRNVLPPAFPSYARAESEVAMFVAMYWWRVKPGKEDQFRAAWRRGTELITARYGSYGSRLHRESDGRFVAYAEWPDYATWKRAFDAKMFYDDAETRRQFVDAIAEAPADGKPVFQMEITDDLLRG